MTNSGRPTKPASDLKDKRDARNSRLADLSHFRPFCLSKKEKLTTEHFIPPHGGYEDLLSFQKARIVYDGTVRFCERLLKKSDRTYDQMVQAARSGKQIFSKAARPRALPKKPKSSSPAWPVPAWVNCSKTTVIFCGCAAPRSGRRNTGTPNASASSIASPTPITRLLRKASNILIRSSPRM